MTDNLYQPTTLRIADSRDEAPDVRTFRLEFTDSGYRSEFFRRYRVGMFGLYGLPGAGESVFCVASPPTRTDHIECTFRKAGRVTSALQDREIGQTISFRGPYGNSFPVDSWKGRDLLFIAGGIALPPLRSVIWNILDRRADFGKVAIVYGARTVADLVYKQELAEWGGRIPTAYGGGTSSGYPSVGRLPTANGGGTSSGYPSVGRKDVDLTLTVDPGGETPDWKGKIAFVPTVLKESAPSSENCTAVVCGPPIMIKLTMPVLRGLGFEPKDIYTTLENRMKCGVGKCGRCNAGGVYVCKDGPVFTLEQFQSLPQGDL